MTQSQLELELITPSRTVFWHEVFHRPSAKEIMNGREPFWIREPTLAKVRSAVATLDRHKYFAAVDGDLLPDEHSKFIQRMGYNPETWKNMNRNEKAGVVAKWGPTLQYPRFNSEREIQKASRGLDRTVDLLRESAESLDDICIGISYYPRHKRSLDNSKRVAHFYAISEGRKYHRFTDLQGPSIKLEKAYDTQGDIRNEGAWARLIAPFRNDGPVDYPVIINHIGLYLSTMVDVGLALIAKHNTPHEAARQRKKSRFLERGTDAYFWEPIGIGALHKIIDYYLKKGEDLPYRSCPIPFVSQRFINLAERLLYDCVLYTRQKPDSDKRYYPLNIMERSLVHGEDVKKTFARNFGDMNTDFSSTQFRLFPRAT